MGEIVVENSLQP